MLTEFQKHKLTVAFHYHDMDHDGFLGKADYEQFVKRFGEIRNYSPGSPQHEAVYTQTMAAWEHLRTAAGKDKDDRVSLGEFLESYDVTLSDGKVPNQRYCRMWWIVTSLAAHIVGCPSRISCPTRPASFLSTN